MNKTPFETIFAGPICSGNDCAVLFAPFALIAIFILIGANALLTWTVFALLKKAFKKNLPKWILILIFISVGPVTFFLLFHVAPNLAQMRTDRNYTNFNREDGKSIDFQTYEPQHVVNTYTLAESGVAGPNASFNPANRNYVFHRYFDETDFSENPKRYSKRNYTVYQEKLSQLMKEYPEMCKPNTCQVHKLPNGKEYVTGEFISYTGSSNEDLRNNAYMKSGDTVIIITSTNLERADFESVFLNMKEAEVKQQTFMKHRY